MAGREREGEREREREYATERGNERVRLTQGWHSLDDNAFA